MNFESFENGFLHRPEQSAGHVLVLTHGASSNCRAPLLVSLATHFSNAGITVYRYDLPYRRKRATGPPSPSSAAADREGVREAVQLGRTLGTGKVVAGGHSYGGRQTSMAAAEDRSLVDGLLLLSYPLHPPGRPEQMRTAHFPNLHARVLFVHGARDGFGREEEMREALQLIPAQHELKMVEGAGHELAKKPENLAPAIVSQAQVFLFA